jgi:hypothetical protein
MSTAAPAGWPSLRRSSLRLSRTWFTCAETSKILTRAMDARRLVGSVPHERAGARSGAPSKWAVSSDAVGRSHSALQERYSVGRCSERRRTLLRIWKALGDRWGARSNLRAPQAPTTNDLAAITGTGDIHTPCWPGTCSLVGQVTSSSPRWICLAQGGAQDTSQLCHASLAQFEPRAERQASPWFICRSESTPSSGQDRWRRR